MATVLSAYLVLIAWTLSWIRLHIGIGWAGGNNSTRVSVCARVLSRIKGWWVLHHFISTVCAGVLLIW